MTNRPPQPRKKPPLSTGAIVSAACVWAVVIGVIVFVVLVSSRERHVTEWIVTNAPSIAFILPDASPPPEPKKPPAVTGVIGNVPAASTVPNRTPLPSSAIPHPTNPSGTYDECSVWGRDTAAYLNCEDHKQKVQSYIQAAQERDAISAEAAAQEEKEAGAKGTDAKKDTKKSAPSPADKKKADRALPK